MIIVLLGPPGSGKGTQGEFLSHAYGIPIISPGNILREALKNGTELGKRAEEYMNAGKLVPDDIIITMMENSIRDNSCNNGCILDGFPRNINQAESLERILDDMEKKIDRVIYFNASDEKIVERLSGRRMCGVCGRVYHILYQPPKEDLLCDVCGEELYQRDDDDPSVVKQRLYTYKKDTYPIIDYYDKKDYYLEVNADQSIETIRTIISHSLGG